MKRIFLIIIGTAFLLVGCENKSTSNYKSESKDSSLLAMRNKESKEIRNRKIVMESIQAFISHNPEVVLKDADPNLTDYGDGSGPQLKGKDSIHSAIKHWMAAFPDIKGEELKVIADGDWVLVWGKWSGTWKGDLMGQKATGKSYKFCDTDIFKVSDDGKILEHHSIQAPITLAHMVGLKVQ